MATAKYAGVSWVPKDLIENAREMGLHLTKKQAQALLLDKEMQIIDVMVQAGWNYIEGVLSESLSPPKRE